MKRFGSVIDLKPEMIEAYTLLHENAWPQVLATIRECHIRNYTIFIYNNTLFAYYEYVGDDYDADMRRMSSDKVTQSWWSICKPMQVPVSQATTNEWWHILQEVFHLD